MKFAFSWIIPARELIRRTALVRDSYAGGYGKGSSVMESPVPIGVLPFIAIMPSRHSQMCQRHDAICPQPLIA